MNLTTDQQYIADEILKKLFEGVPQEIIISGPAGTGKSFLLKYILDTVYKKYKIMCKVCGIDPMFAELAPIVTATTHKAVGVLRESLDNIHCPETIESALNLRVKGDESSGKYKLIPAKNGLSHFMNAIIIVDEASMIDKELFAYIRKACLNCFVIFVGDGCQLPAVREGEYPYVFTLGLPEYKLNTLVRQADNPVLADVCSNIRNSVENLITTNTIDTCDSIIKVTDPEEQKKILLSLGPDDKILTFTNSKSILYNNWISEQRYGNIDKYNVGNTYISNSFYSSPTSSAIIRPEESVVITKINKEFEYSYGNVDCVFYQIQIDKYPKYYHLAVKDSEEYRAFLKEMSKNKNWNLYFQYKEGVLDLRENYSCTIHKAQGSTFDTVIIDAEDFKHCRNPKLAIRLLYVAISRAKHKVIFFGNLPKKYGVIK